MKDSGGSVSIFAPSLIIRALPGEAYGILAHRIISGF